MFFILTPVFALTPSIQDKSPMRECRSWGSVRGVLGDWHPYRDPTLGYGFSYHSAGSLRFAHCRDGRSTGPLTPLGFNETKSWRYSACCSKPDSQKTRHVERRKRLIREHVREKVAVQR